MSDARAPALVWIFGPAAVGKMTVGQELRKLTGYRLLYNHMVVDLVTEFFEYGTPGFHRLAKPFTEQIIEACAAERAGLIVTHSLFFSAPGSRALIEEWSSPYTSRGMPVWSAELTASLDVRIARNATPNRAAHKKIDWSTPEQLRKLDEAGSWNSDGVWPDPGRHLVIDNTTMPAAEAAARIRERFEL